MSVRRRRWRDSSGALHEEWMIDVQVVGKDGRLRRMRKIAPMQTRRAAEKLEHETRAELMQADDRAVTPSPEAPRWKLAKPELARRQLPLPDRVGQVRHPLRRLGADRRKGHAARVHALEQADPGAE